MRHVSDLVGKTVPLTACCKFLYFCLTKLHLVL